MYPRVARSVVAVEVPAGAGMTVGSGIVTGPGQVLTACHVLAGRTGIRVRYAGRAYPATLRRSEPRSDLCELAVHALPTPAVAMGSLAGLERGAALYAFAMPGGYRVEMSEGVLTGIVRHPEHTLVQTTARFDRGWSGGGLFTASGELLGLLDFVLEGPGGAEHFAVGVEAFSGAANAR